MRLSKHTASFIVIMALTLIAAYAAIYVNRKLNRELANSALNTNSSSTGQPDTMSTSEPIDTSSWKTYTDKKFPISFKYPENWTIATSEDKELDLYLVLIKPGVSSSPIALYITKDNYFAVDGLSLQEIKLNNLEGINSNDYIVGVKKDSMYYTFDLTTNTQLKNVFFGILNTVEIGQ